MAMSDLLFANHLSFARLLWGQLLKLGDLAIDATCGNGHDTLALSKLVLTPVAGKVIGCDIQQTALENTRERLKEQLLPHQLKRIELHLISHAAITSIIGDESPRLVVFNLGYLPGGDKSLTTRLETTLEALRHLLPLVQKGGAISLTCYRGHPEGEREERALLEFAKRDLPSHWIPSHHRWPRQERSPSLLFLQCAGGSL